MLYEVGESGNGAQRNIQSEVWTKARTVSYVTEYIMIS
jgi:hypothetical protein